jgi:hypothetical protein
MLRASLGLLFVVSLATALAACGHSSDGATAEAKGHENRSGECATCHLLDYQSAGRHEGVKPTTCGVCHSQDGWHPTHLEHAFPLEGAHKKAKCFACHDGKPPVYEGTPRECVACHRDDYKRAPKHDKFPDTCAMCHSTEAWKPDLPNHPWPAHSAAATATPTAAPVATPTATPTTRPTSTSTTPKPKPKPKPTTSPTTLPTTKPVPTDPPILTQPSGR